MAGDAAGLELAELLEGSAHVAGRGVSGQADGAVVDPLVALDEFGEAVAESGLNSLALGGMSVE